MRVVFFITTVGEASTMRVIDKFHEHVPFGPHIVLWYDSCGRGVDWDFYRRASAQVSNVILVRNNLYLSAAWGLASLYIPCDYLVTATADEVPLPGFWERMMAPFNERPRVGVSGEAWRPSLDKNVVYNDYDVSVDGIAAWNKLAINEAGGFNPSFKGFANCHNELQRRMHKKGWDFAAMDGLCEPGNLVHEGRDKNQNIAGEIHLDNLAYLDADARGYHGYEWWSDRLGKEKVCV